MEIRELLDQPREVFERFAESRAKPIYLGEGTALCRVLGKYLLYVDPMDTSLAPHLMMDGYWESWITLALARLKPDTLCVDVGANAGYFTLLLAELCGEVIAYEPQKDLAKNLVKSAGVNGFRDCIQVYNMAVGATSGTVRLVETPNDPNNRGCVSVEEVDAKTPTTTRIQMVSLDGHLNNSRKVGFVKIDAEGFEPQIWAGMKNIIAQHKPIILLEFTPDAYENAGEFLDEIASCYSLREVDTNGSVVAVDREAVLTKNDFTMLWLEAEEL